MLLLCNERSRESGAGSGYQSATYDWPFKSGVLQAAMTESNWRPKANADSSSDRESQARWTLERRINGFHYFHRRAFSCYKDTGI